MSFKHYASETTRSPATRFVIPVDRRIKYGYSLSVTGSPENRFLMRNNKVLTLHLVRSTPIKFLNCFYLLRYIPQILFFFFLLSF